MEQTHFPVKSNFEAIFYFLCFRIMKRIPASIFLVLLILLVGFSVATGYLINGGAEVRADQLSALTAASSLKLPETGYSMTGKNGARRHTISLGAYVLKRNFEDEKALADSLGQPFHIIISEKRVTLTRLFLGTYPERESATVLARMKKISPDAFLVHHEKSDTVSVYGGSFYYSGEADKQEALFARHGVIATKAPTRMTLPLYTACMGDFDNRAMAVEFLRSAALSKSDTAVVPIL